MVPTGTQICVIFALIWGALIASGCWEAYVEGRSAWDKGKLGWKVQMGPYLLTGYHFYLFYIMYPLLFALPFVFTGWNFKLFGVIVSAYATGTVLEDFTWYLVNPAVKLSELFTPFSDYYPWIRVGGKKIVPVLYVGGIIVALLSWFFIWK